MRMVQIIHARGALRPDQSRDSALGCLPFVRVTLGRDALTAAQRSDMLARVIEAVVAIEGAARRPNIWAVIQSSVLEGEWSIGGGNRSR